VEASAAAGARSPQLAKGFFLGTLFVVSKIFGDKNFFGNFLY